jgi:transcription elongation factor Elf1
VGGTQSKNTQTPAPLAQNAGEPFSFVVPTEFVDLPSRGRYYPESHPLHGQDTIEIKHMTAKEEDILTSRSLLKNGTALDRVIQNIIVDKRVNADSLLVGDRNAVVIAARVSGYGPVYETKVACPACGETQEYSFTLNDAEVYEGDGLDTLEIKDNGNGTFDVELPRTMVTTTFRLLTGHDEKRLIAKFQKKTKKKGVENNVTQQLSNMIVAVNGDGTPQAIQYLIDNMPSMDSRHLRLAYRLAAPNVDLTQNFECSECGHEQDMEVPLSADFFWPDR